MNYKLHYDKLIERSKDRKLEGYSESHHIIPKCMGGTNDKSNLARLTAREHYIAHQLLIKIYPKNKSLIYAAYSMCYYSFTNKERKYTNRIYEWLKIRHSKYSSMSQSGKGNSQYGYVWISNEKEKICKQIKKDELSEYLQKGWIKLRIRNFDLYLGKKENIELKKKEILKKTEENIKIYKKYFDIYNLYGFTKFKEITNYKFSYPNLVRSFKIYIDNFIPQNGMKRGTELVKEIKSNKESALIKKYNELYKSYIELNSDFDKFKIVNSYTFQKQTLLARFKKYVKEYKSRKSKFSS